MIVLSLFLITQKLYKTPITSGVQKEEKIYFVFRLKRSDEIYRFFSFTIRIKE